MRLNPAVDLAPVDIINAPESIAEPIGGIADICKMYDVEAEPGGKFVRQPAYTVNPVPMLVMSNETAVDAAVKVRDGNT